MFHAKLPELLASKHFSRACLEFHVAERTIPHHPLSTKHATSQQQRTTMVISFNSLTLLWHSWLGVHTACKQVSAVVDRLTCCLTAKCCRHNQCDIVAVACIVNLVAVVVVIDCTYEPYVFSQSVATSSAECNRSSLVCGQLLTICNIAWHLPQGHMSVAAGPHFFNRTQWPWLVRKRFAVPSSWQLGRLNPG